jgi:beta-glucuronidase
MLEKMEGLSGCTPWILTDFRSPRRVLAGIQDGFNRKGLISNRGIKKAAFYVMQEWYESLK